MFTLAFLTPGSLATAAGSLFSKHPSVIFLLASLLLYFAASFFQKLGQVPPPPAKSQVRLKNIDESSYEI
jgi:hypothetical protein